MFDVAAEAYDAFMGVYSTQLAVGFCDFAGIVHGQRVLDVGCGPGALIQELAGRLGPSAVHAVDPSTLFVMAARERHPGVEIGDASAEQLPFPDQAFDSCLAQLVVHFMSDPVGGLREMARVTKRGGVVAACVWDHAGGGGPLSRFWDAARQLGPHIADESELAGTRQGHLVELLEALGLSDVVETVLTVSVEYASFDDWWLPFTFGVGPAGAWLATLSDDDRASVRELSRRAAPDGSLTVTARAWAARGLVV